MAGRPTKYKPEYCKQAEKLCKLGATDKDLADFFGVEEQTINNWKKDFPEFFESLKGAKSDLDAQVEQSLFRRAMGYSHPAVKIFQRNYIKLKSKPTNIEEELDEDASEEGNESSDALIVPYTEYYPPDPTSMIFWLKNRQPQKWRDKQEHEHTGDINVIINRKPKE